MSLTSFFHKLTRSSTMCAIIRVQVLCSSINIYRHLTGNVSFQRFSIGSPFVDLLLSFSERRNIYAPIKRPRTPLMQAFVVLWRGITSKNYFLKYCDKYWHTKMQDQCKREKQNEESDSLSWSPASVATQARKSNQIVTPTSFISGFRITIIDLPINNKTKREGVKRGGTPAPPPADSSLSVSEVRITSLAQTDFRILSVLLCHFTFSF